MIKKQVICCAAVLSLLLYSKGTVVHHRAEGERQKYETAANSIFTEDVSQVENSAYFASLRFADEDLPLGDQQIEKKMMKHLQAVAFKKTRSLKMHKQAAQHLPLIESILIEEGVPSDFKYIPLIESGLTANTSSPKGASGYWQFIPATARNFGLVVNGEIDERQDLVKSTRAAARYLKALYKEFNSWTLVAAAFNMGDSKLRSAIQKQREDNYFRLKLNRETSEYVYKIISMKEVIEHPTHHGYKINTLLAQNHSDKTERKQF
jgi:membrane-bound lytic murein transglycosylase D